MLKTLGQFSKTHRNVWDPEFELRDLEKNYSGSRIQGSKRHGIPDPEYWQNYGGHSF
jgi:hypothetical protein